jgi:non-specific serine/threonine protein kinase
MPNEELIVIFTPTGFYLDKSETKNKNVYFDTKIWQQFEENQFQMLYNFGFHNEDNTMSLSLKFLHRLAKQFLKMITQDSELELTRTAKIEDNLAPIYLEIMHQLPYATGMEYINIQWIHTIFEALGEQFDQEITVFKGSVAEYFKKKNANINVVGRIFFHLVENKQDEFPFAFLATYSTRTGTGEKKAISHMPLKNALLEYQGRREQLLSLLSTVSKTADQSEFISELVESGELFSPLKFRIKEAYTFLKEVPMYENGGIICRIPDWWKKKGNIRMSLTVGAKEEGSTVGMEALMEFQPRLFLNDMQLTRAEIEALLAETGGLSYIKGKWVEVDHEKLALALKAFDNVKAMGEVSFAEAMRMQLQETNQIISEKNIEIEITNGTWLQNMKERLLHPTAIEQDELVIGEGLKANLRHYQKTGFCWLHTMKSLGFGALLADDMGLGKTVQILALLEYLRKKEGGKTLLILPASLLFNWQNEADRFTPELNYRVIHANKREFSLVEADLFITTYGMAMRLESLAEVCWDFIILDEAQAIKNSATKQTKAIKELKSRFRIAMTGTPIENRLSDLWSIFDFLNKGLLGSAKEFTDFTKSLNKDTANYAKLRDVVSPFILRRLKTDKAVITDLPDKVEMMAYATLTKKQVMLYNNLIKELQTALADAAGIARKGLVIASILKFKQICNHPDQYLGQGSFDTKYSGKFEKLQEICQTIYEKRERVLVFTQFKEMTKPLADFLEGIFERKGLVLHGGVATKKRGTLVEQFNGEVYIPFMVLSLKAGGVGLNLTSANHVIHFDRWWNPAIENQATDRAFRIGQKKNVMVHKFVTTGTIEAKINTMLEEKQKMAEDIIESSAGENWITEMSNEELMNLFTLAT